MLVGAMGDSITTAFNAFRPDNNLAYSWSTGSESEGAVQSHLQRLAKIFPQVAIEGVNVAFSGAKAGDLGSQTAKLLPLRPDYATILVGANDLYVWLFAGEFGSLLEKFRSDVETAVVALTKANRRVMILLSGIPDQTRVLHLVVNGALRGTGLSESLLARFDSTMAEGIKNKYRDRWERANEALASIAVAHTANVRFAAKTPRVQFTEQHLSPVDFYHPSIAGQRLLAEVTWGQGFFP